MARARIALLLAALAWAAPAGAQVPRLLEVQGRLEDPVGVPVTQPVTLTLRLYDAASAGTQLTSETDLVSPDAGGLFTSTLGDAAPLDPSDFGRPLWLGVTVDEAGGGSELSPRQPLRAAPYALRVPPPPQVVEVFHEGDDAASGAALLAAMAGITDASATRRYLLRLGPGTFDLAPSILTMKPYVDVVGAGRELTRLRSLGQGNHQLGTVVLAEESALASLSVRNEGGTFGAQGVFADGVRAAVRDVRIHVGGSDNNRALFLQGGADVVLRDSELVVDSAATQTATAVENGSGRVRVHGCHLEVVAANTGVSSGVRSSGASSVTTLTDTEIDVTTQGGQAMGVYILGTSVHLRGVAARVRDASGGATARGFHVQGAGLETRITACSFTAAAASGEALGGWIEGTGDDLRILGTSLRAAAGATRIGLRVQGGTSALVGSDVEGATASLSLDGGTLEVVGSRLLAGAASNDGGTLRVGSTYVQGGVTTASGTSTCFASFGAGFTNTAVDACP